MTKFDKPDWEAFGREIMTTWPDGGIDGFELQDVALKYAVLVPIPGGFDPTKHNDDGNGAEPGDDWFTRNYLSDDDKEDEGNGA